MATAQSRFLSEVHGRFDNALPHYAFTRNGHQFVGFVRKGWCRELHTDTQKITALRFAYATAISNMLNAVYRAGLSESYVLSISYLFRTVKVGKQTYFFDDTIFAAVNEIMSHYFDTDRMGAQFFVQSKGFPGPSDEPIPHWSINETLLRSLGGKTAVRYALASLLMNNADQISLPTLYDQLSQVVGADYDEDEIYPLADVHEAYNLLILNLYHWAKVPIYDITPDNYDIYLANKSTTDHRRDFPQYVAEQSYPPYVPE